MHLMDPSAYAYLQPNICASSDFYSHIKLFLPLDWELNIHKPKEVRAGPDLNNDNWMKRWLKI